MRAERLFEALGLVDDRLVEEAADARRTAVPWRKWAAMAACLVVVLGVGSLTFGSMLRGCGGSSADAPAAAEAPAAPEAAMQNSSGAAAFDAPAAADMETASAADGAPAEAPAGGPAKGDAPADAPAAAPPADLPAADAAPAPEPSAGSGTNGSPAAADVPQMMPSAVTGLEPLEDGAGPALTLSAQGAAALTAERTLELSVLADHAAVTDRYLVSNFTDQDVEASFSYPAAGNLASLEASGLTISADGGLPALETSFTSARYAFAADGNLTRPDWAALYARRGEALSPPDLDETVTLWEIRNVEWDGAAAGGCLTVSFEKPAETRVLYNGFSGRGVRDGRDFCEDEVTLNPDARREIAFLGEAPRTWTVQGADMADRTRLRADIGCEISVRTLSLGDYLRTLTGSDLERDLLAELLSLDLAETRGGDLRRLTQLNLRAARIFDHSFRLTVPAGWTVEITASCQLRGCWTDDASAYEYAVLPAGGGDLTLTKQTASVTLDQGVQWLGGSLRPGTTPLRDGERSYLKAQ